MGSVFLVFGEVFGVFGVFFDGFFLFLLGCGVCFFWFLGRFFGCLVFFFLFFMFFLGWGVLMLWLKNSFWSLIYGLGLFEILSDTMRPYQHGAGLPHERSTRGPRQPP